MFGFSFSELVLIGVVTVAALGPDRFRELGAWIKSWFDGP